MLTSSLGVATSSQQERPYVTLVRNLPNAVALDFSLSDDVIFWSDLDRGHVMRATLSGSDVKVVVSTGIEEPGGLAVDWIHKKIVWTDAGRARIEVSDFSGKMRRVLVHEDIDKPRAIAVHPALG